MRKRLQLKWMLIGSTLLATSFTLNSAAFAVGGDGTSRGIAITGAHGRTIYVNDDAPAKERPAAAPQVRRSNLVYWRSKENRWRAVPSAKTESARAARSAAAEVSEFYGRDSVHSANAKILLVNSQGCQAIPEEIDQSIEIAAARHNIDPNLVHAVNKMEWNFNCSAISRKGAMGLMQLMPKTDRDLNVKNPFDPEQNADAGVRQLKCLLDKYNGDVNLTLAGITRVRQPRGGVQALRPLPKPRIACAESRTFITGELIPRNRALAAIPCMFNEMSGVCFTSATRTR